MSGISGVGPIYEARLSVCESDVTRLKKVIDGNGQPGLETRIMSTVGTIEGRLKQHIESVERHATANMQQGDSDVLEELKEEKEVRQKQHEQNQAEQKELGKKIDRLTIIQATMTGGLLLFKVLEDMGWIHAGVR